MKLGELFVQLGVQGDTKELKKTLRDMKEADRLADVELKKRKALKNATDEQEKSLVKENAERKKQIALLQAESDKEDESKAKKQQLIRGFLAFATAIGVAYTALSRITDALVKANASMITFNRTTGIGFGSLNKYASAAMAVNPNATIEGTAQTMGNLAQNLYDIRMGRGDISPYQELAFVGGKPFNPMGMNVEQVIESVREAIKGVDDIQATNIITRMGFSPEDLQMLRMSRQELEGIQSLFLNTAEREEIQRLGIEYKKLQLQTQLYWQRGLIQMIPALLKVMNFMKGLAKQLTDTITLWGEAFDRVTDLAKGCDILAIALKGLAVALGTLFSIQHPFMAGIMALYVILEDIVGYFLGWDSLLIPSLKMLGDFLVGWINDIGDRIKAKGGWLKSIADFIRNVPLSLAQFGSSAVMRLTGMVTGGANTKTGALPALLGVATGGAANNQETYNVTNIQQGYLGQLPQLEPVPVGQNPNINTSYDNRTSNINQTNNFRISALPENMAGAVSDSIMDVSYNAIIAQNIPQVV